ncbi:MAG: FAD-binding oxidoreductase, partial [Pseudonocardiaceae bacterium]
MTPPVTGILALRAAMTGSVILPEDEGYHDVRRVWNGEIDRCPAVIARCESPADVVAAISLARDQDLELSVRGGGHNVWGSSVGDDGMMVHLGGMNQVSVDPAAKRVRVGGGA